MRTLLVGGFSLVAILAASGGFLLGQARIPWDSLAQLSGLPTGTSETLASPESSGKTVLYYRHPKGLPSYSPVPTTTQEGTAFLAVYEGEDVDLNSDNVEVSEPKDVVASEERKLLYYRHPMGLPDTSPTPKKDSMGMDYIPVYEGDVDDTGIVVVSPGKMQRSGVRSELSSMRVIARDLLLPGQVVIDERRVTVVATRSIAFVDRVADVTTGDRVESGAPLLWLYSAEIASAGAQYLTALQAGGGADGARQRLLNLGVALDAIDAIERERTIPLSTVWTAPQGGVIVERNAMQGMQAQPGDVLFRIADLSRVWVVADVPEYQLNLVKVGARAKVSVTSSSGTVLPGTVALVYPDVDPTTRTARVRIEVDNADGIIFPGMYAQVTIEAGGKDPVLAVPDTAVIDSGERQAVILDLGEGRFEPRQVSTGLQGDGFTEILSGIEAGDRIVVSANFLIDAESNLNAAFAGMTATGESQQ